MLTVTAASGFGAASQPAPVDISFITSAVSASDLTTYTFSSQSFGAAGAGRKLVIAASGKLNSGAATTISSVTADGNSCTRAIIVDTAVGEYVCSLFYLDNDAATSGDVVLVFPVQQATAGIGIFRVMNGASGAPASTGEDDALPSGDPVFNLTVAKNGGVICSGVAELSGGNMDWTGTSGLETEDYDETLDTGKSHSGVRGLYSVAQTPLAVTNNVASGKGWGCGVAIDPA